MPLIHTKDLSESPNPKGWRVKINRHNTMARFWVRGDLINIQIRPMDTRLLCWVKI